MVFALAVIIQVQELHKKFNYQDQTEYRELWVADKSKKSKWNVCAMDILRRNWHIFCSRFIVLFIDLLRIIKEKMRGRRMAINILNGLLNFLIVALKLCSPINSLITDWRSQTYHQKWKTKHKTKGFLQMDQFQTFIWWLIIGCWLYGI